MTSRVALLRSPKVANAERSKAAEALFRRRLHRLGTAALLGPHMRQQPSASPERVVRLLVATVIGVLVVLTLLERGATAIYATPWNAFRWFVQLAPIVGLALRAVHRAAPMRLPPSRWLLSLAGLAAVIELSAALSPYRGISVLASCAPLAAVAMFLLLHDWIARDRDQNADVLLRIAGAFSALIVVTSMGRWIFQDLRTAAASLGSWAGALRIQNDHPLGHTSYTAGLALLALPWPAVLAYRSHGLRRWFWATVTVLGVAMLLSSGSRGGIVGAGALLGAMLWLTRWGWRRTLLTATVALVLVGLAAYAHPRTRALLFERPAEEAPNLSNVQRLAMAKAGWLMGRERPFFGWGTGTTSRAYPQFRSQLDGGVEDALQLHSTPVQLWAELGGAGVAVVAALLALALVEAIRARRELGPGNARDAFHAAILSLVGYGAFSLTDYQLDVPAFAFGLAAAVARVTVASGDRGQSRETNLHAGSQGEGTPPAGSVTSRRVRPIIAMGALIPLVLMVALGRPDPAPELNVQALQLAGDPAQTDRTIGLLRESLRLNPDQEIAHFNLGWLLVVRDPAEAEQHFLSAARLVPDKGGVYFGLALARINQGSTKERSAIRALALECLNDPIFLVSPWWNNPALQPLRGASINAAREMAGVVAADARLQGNRPLEREAAYVVALADWLKGNRTAADMIGVANTPERRIYFQRDPARPDFARAKVRKYRRERTGYPVLMRDLDLPPPVDVFDVQENDLALGEFRFLFPPKGWAPSPELLKFLRAE